MTETGKCLRPDLNTVEADSNSHHNLFKIKPVRVFVGSIDRRQLIAATASLHFTSGEFEIWSAFGRPEEECDGIEPTDVYTLYGPPENTDEPYSFAGPTYIGIAFRRETVVRLLADLLDSPVTLGLDLRAEYDSRSTAGSKLERMTNLLWTNLVSAPEDASTRSTDFLFRAILVALLEIVPHPYSKQLNGRSSPAAPRQLKRAIEYMTANISYPIGLSDIARYAGVSTRSLQLAFQQFKGMAPMAYLRQLRLEGVRRALLSETNSGLSVRDVARQWGFVHPSRFAGIYRETFGELPYTTKLRSGNN